MKRIFISAALFFCVSISFAQISNVIRIPDIPGYKTLKCDFHTHSVFSDGLVWPTVRVEEAYNEGLDAIAITEHIEYRPHHHNKDMQGDHNRSYELASEKAKELNILVIKGSEITRRMPPGHWNALFLQDCNLLDTPEYKDAFKEAAKQKAYTFWNHPGWYAQAFEVTKWYNEHTELYNQGYMYGIEVGNGSEYYPEAFQWALDKNLTILANSDIHGPIGSFYDLPKGEHRTMTLVFAKERSTEAIRDALEKRRTIAWIGNSLFGREDLLKELFKQVLRVENVERKGNRIQFVLRNDSDFTLHIVKGKHDTNLEYFKDMVIRPHERRDFGITFLQPTSAKVKMDFMVENFRVTPEKGLDYSVEFDALK